MSKTLQQEIRQGRPFATLEAEAFVSLKRTAALLEREFAEVLRPHGLTPVLYNVLRILRGAGEAGLCRYEVSERLIAPDPDVTRLLDRLEAAGLASRTRDADNRRLVKARVTPAGLNLLEQLEAALTDLHRRQLGHLGEERLRALVDLLAEARTGS